MSDKNLSTVFKLLPRLILAKEMRGILGSLIHQWGGGNVVRILKGTIKRTGVLNNLKYLLAFRLDKLMPHQLIAMWDVFGDREAIISGERRITYREL
ncbi:MAG: hypothetical protein E4H39_00945, partial [Syntrophobacterales bacterium]